MFEAVILAGGQGKRLKSVTGDLPKPMVEIDGQPFLYLLMKKLESQGCHKIVLSLCYRGEYIEKRVLADKPVNCKVDFSKEDSPLGTGGAIKHAVRLIGSEKCIVLNGDTYLDVNYANFFQAASESDLVISGIQVDHSGRYGTMIIDEQNNVVSFNEKKGEGQGIINSGTYIIAVADFKTFPKEKFSFEEDFIPNYAKAIKAFISTGFFIDIGIPEDYRTACQKLIQK